MFFSIVKVIGLAALALSAPVFAQEPLAPTAPLSQQPIQTMPIRTTPLQASPILQSPTLQPTAQPGLTACPVLGARTSLPVQQALMSAIQSQDPILKLQAIREHYSELLTQSTEANNLLKDQGRTLIAFMDNLIESAKIRQQQIRSQPSFAQPQPVLLTPSMPSARPSIQQPVMGIPVGSLPVGSPSSSPSVGIFQSSYSSQSAVCANLAVESAVEKSGSQLYNLRIKPLENMEFIDVHFQFNDDPLQQIHKRAAEGVAAQQEIHVPIKLDANQRNIKYYVTSKALDKVYQCDTPMFTFDI